MVIGFAHSPLLTFLIGLAAVVLLLVVLDLPAFVGLVLSAYLVMTIGAGGNVFSWYNDSGFWLVKEIGGLTQAETLKTWTALTTIITVTGIVTTLVLSTVVKVI